MAAPSAFLLNSLAVVQGGGKYKTNSENISDALIKSGGSGELELLLR